MKHLPVPFALAAITSPLAAAQATLIELPPAVTAVSDAGDSFALVSVGLASSTGGAQFSAPVTVAIDGTVRRLDMPPGVDSAIALAVDAAAENFVGHAYRFLGGGLFVQSAHRWDGQGHVTELAEPQGGVGRPTAVSDTGGWIAGTFPQGILRWTPAGAPEPLVTGPGWNISQPRHISDDGTVVAGDHWVTGFTTEPYRWTASGGVQLLGNPPGHSMGWVRGMTPDGSLLVVSGNSNGPTEASWFWTASGGYVPVPRRAPGSRDNVRDMGDDGRLLFGETLESGPDEPFVWTERFGAESLTAYLMRYGWTPTPGMVLPTTGVRCGPRGRTFLLLRPDLFSNDRYFLAHTGAADSIGDDVCAPATPNQTGVPGRLELSGAPYVAANDLQLVARDLPPDAFTMFVASRAAAAPTLPPGSVGALCLGPPIRRFNRPGEIVAANGAGLAELELDLDSVPGQAGPIAVQPGDTWVYQAWYRDRSGGVSVGNFTNGSSVTFNP